MLRYMVGCWIILSVIQTARAVPAWRTELALWTHAARHAPLKPRPAVNLGKALILAGQYDEAEQALYRALLLAEQPHIPIWDRQDAIAAATANLQALAVMRVILGPEIP